MIVGPESRVRDVASATTEPVEIDGKRRARARRRDRRRHGLGGPAGRQPQSATVVIEILPAPIEREVTGVPVR